MAAFQDSTISPLVSRVALGIVNENCKPVVVGVDFGTAYSGIAYAFKSDPNLVDYGAPSKLDGQIKVPTALLQNDDGSWEFGNNAVMKYQSMMVNAEKGQTPKFYKRYKMALKGKTTGRNSLTAFSVCGMHTENLMTLIVVSLKILKDYTLEMLGSKLMKIDNVDDIQWVLTVPAIWNDFGKAFMRRAAYEAGMIRSEHSDNLMLALEPEGAAIAVQSAATQQDLLQTHSKYVILDCGGGTVDITAHQVVSISPLEMKSIAEPDGGDWGGDYVNLNFRKFLTKLLSYAENKIDESDYPDSFHEIDRKFNELKIVFDPVNDTAGSFKLSDIDLEKGELLRIVQAYNRDDANATKINESPSDLIAYKKNTLSISKDLMLSFFEPLLRASVCAVRNILKKVDGIQFVVVVGGFGGSSVVKKRMMTEFDGYKNIRCICPPKPQSTIAIGAVYHGLYQACISRVSSSTYGIAFHNDVFRIAVSKGEELALDHEVTIEGTPVTEDQDECDWRVLRSDMIKPTRHADGTELGRITVKCPVGGTLSSRRMVAVLKFGGSEIVVDIENNKGERFRGCINMS